MNSLRNPYRIGTIRLCGFYSWISGGRESLFGRSVTITNILRQCLNSRTVRMYERDETAKSRLKERPEETFEWMGGPLADCVV
jgi:hypothetical protein